MGRNVLDLGEHDHRIEVIAAITSPRSSHIGQEIAGVKLSTDIRAALDMCDVLIDFSHPKAAIDAALLMHEKACKAFISGTTGYTPTEERALEQAANSIALVKSGNFSIGICVLEMLVKKTCALLGPDWDVDVLDIHHRFKKDAPSGTAFMLAKAAQDGRNAPTHVEFAALRHGGVVGMHTVNIASLTETISLSHTAIDRSVFAKGAIDAALWAVNQPAGLYSMQDVLGISAL